MVTVSYWGETFSGRIKSAKLVGRELFVVVASERFKEPKCLHHTHVRIQKAVAQTARAA